MIPNNPLIIAVDFDGTIVADAYPKIGKPMLFAFDTLKKLQSEGHRLILWTYRSEEKLEEAILFCKKIYLCIILHPLIQHQRLK